LIVDIVSRKLSGSEGALDDKALQEETQMTEPPAYPDPGADAGVGSDRGSPPGTPRWVKVFGMIALVLVVAIVIVLLVGGGHGPGRHAP
jgi:hypothetical protein